MRYLALLVVGLIVSNVGAQPQEAAWTTDLSKMVIPDRPASGMLFGQPFQLQKASIDEFGLTNLTLSQGKASKETKRVLFWITNLKANKKESLEGKKYEIATDGNPGGPLFFGVTLSWVKEGSGNNLNAPINRGNYALKLEFGKIKDKRLPGKIYLCVKDKEKSFVAGTFLANIED